MLVTLLLGGLACSLGAVRGQTYDCYKTCDDFPSLYLHRRGTFEESDLFYAQLDSLLESTYCQDGSFSANYDGRGGCRCWRKTRTYKKLVRYMQRAVCGNKGKRRNPQVLKERLLNLCPHLIAAQINTPYGCRTSCKFVDHMAQICFDRANPVPDVELEPTPVTDGDVFDVICDTDAKGSLVFTFVINGVTQAPQSSDRLTVTADIDNVDTYTMSCKVSVDGGANFSPQSDPKEPQVLQPRSTTTILYPTEVYTTSVPPGSA